MPGDLSLERTQTLPRPIGEVFDFFADARNLGTITPPWLHFRIVEAPDRLERGSIIRYRLRVKGAPVRWKTEILDWNEPRSFTDLQVSGPYPLWVHTHRFTPVEGGTEVYDHVRYRVPGGPLGGAVQAIVARWLDDVFDFRRDRLTELLGGDQEEGAEPPASTRRAGTSVSNDVSGA